MQVPLFYQINPETRNLEGKFAAPYKSDESFLADLLNDVSHKLIK